MFQRRMGRRAAFWGGELFVHRCAIARHRLLVVGAGLRAPTIRRLFGGVRTEEQPRSALRLFFCIALCAIARHSLLVVGQGLRAPTIRRLLGGVRAEEQPRSALRLFLHRALRDCAA